MSTAPAASAKWNNKIWLAIAVMLFLGVAPVIGMIVITAMLGRDCSVLSTTEGEARPNLLWRIEVQQCGSGPAITNVLIAPRGKSFALAVSARGQPTPIGVERSEDGRAWVMFDRKSADGSMSRMLPLKATGRPAQPLVLFNGDAVR